MKINLLLTIAALVISWSAMAAQNLPDKDWNPVSGDVTYNATDVINIHIAGTDDNQYDRLELISGTLFPSGATLNVFPCYQPTPGDRFVIFKAPTIDGEFSNPPLIDAGGNFFVLSYESEEGSNNDLVVLTAVTRVFGLNIGTSGSSTVEPDYLYSLEIVTEPADRGNLTISKEDFSVCDVVEFEVQPHPISSPAFIFTHWSQEGGAAIENTASKTTTARMPARDVKLIANFEQLDPVPLTITGTFTAENKIYDGTVTATMSTNNLQLVGFSDLRGNDVTLTDIVLTFDNADIGMDKTVTIASAKLSGIHAGNYTLDLTGAPTTIANITAKVLTINGTFAADDKIYDGNKTASEDVSNLELVGIVGSEDVNLTGVVLEFADKNVGAHSVSITAANLSGTAIGNYTLTLTGAPTTSASITAKELTIDGSFTASDKIYDGTTAATINDNNLTLEGIVSPDDVTIGVVTLTFDSKDVGEHPVTITAATITGAQAGNYTLSLTDAPTTSASITAKELTIGGSFTASDKIYDGTTAATINDNNLTLEGIVSPDDVTIGVVNLTFDSKNVGTHIVSINAADLSGSAIGNYTLTLTGAPTATADITPKQLTIGGSFTAKDKVEDGNADAEFENNNLTLTGIVGSDNVILTDVQISFNNADVGENKPVSITSASLTGTHASNYILSLSGAPTTTANITSAFTCGDPITFNYRGSSVTYGTVEKDYGGTIGKRCWMDRNLGASRVATSPTDSQAYGHLFQWGRSDDGHQLRNSSPISGPTSNANPGSNFITVGSGNWYNGSTPAPNDLWKVDGTGINEPCPEGWRVPTEAELTAERLSWSSNNSGGAFASTLRWPVGGMRLTDGSLTTVDSVGRVWGSSGSGSDASNLYFDSSTALMGNNFRVFGMSVRCVKN